MVEQLLSSLEIFATTGALKLFNLEVHSVVVAAQVPPVGEASLTDRALVLFTT